jgi:MoaD family protein
MFAVRVLITVNVSGHLKDYTGGTQNFQMSVVPNLRSLIEELNAKFPGIKDRIFDDQERVRPYVNIFVNGENSREGHKEETRLNEGDTIHILPSVAGG